MIGHSDYSGISILDSMLAWYAIPLIGYWIIEQILHHFDYSPTPITIPCQPDLFTSCLNISWLASLSTHLHDSMLALSMCPLFEYWMNGQSHRSSTRFHVSLICALAVWILVEWSVLLLLYMILCQPDLCTRCLNISWMTNLLTPLHDSMSAWSVPSLFEY